MIAMRIVGTEDNTLTFGETYDRMLSIAYRLTQEGVDHGDRVALIGENHPSWAIAYLGTVYRGAVIVPLDPHGEIETITNFLENSQAKVAFLSPDQTTRFSQIEEKLGRHIPAVVWDLEHSTNGFKHFNEWAKTEVPDSYRQATPAAKNEDMAVLMYTSGTTGTPKGVPLTHGNIISELEGVNYVLELSDKERILSLLPLFHAYLQIVNLWVASTYGCQVGYLKELTPAELSEAMKTFKPTILTTVPRLWYLFHKKIFDAIAAKPAIAQKLARILLKLNGALRNTIGVNLGKTFFGQVHDSFGGELRTAISAGSRFDEDVAVDFQDLGFTILQGYGLTETSGAATATYEDDNRVGSVGKPMHGCEIKINEPDKDGTGEVLIRGPIVFAGYYNNPEATKEAFTADGWFRSGDLGKIVNGHLYIVGRAKDVIVLPSGKNVHPEDLEVHYLKCPLIEELAIVGVADESDLRAGSEKLAAVIVPDFEYLKLQKIANSKEAIRHELDTLGRELPEYQRVREYIIRAEPLPRTATRKIKRFQLKKEIESGEIAGQAKEQKQWVLSAEDKALMDSPSGRAVAAAITQNLKEPQDIAPQMNLEIDLGLDSLARAETFAALEQAFDTEFNAEDAGTALTVKSVIELVKQTPSAKELDKNGGDLSLNLNWGKIVNETDESMPELRSLLKERYLFAPFAFIVMKIANLFWRVFLRLDIKGIEHIQKMEKPFLICPNHQSFIDPFVLCGNYPYRILKDTFHVGASEFFENGFMKFVAKMLNIVPVNPDTELMRAMKAGATGLKHGKVLNIYPEGERAFDGELHPFKKGAAILATELDLPIIPVALDGLQNVWARGSMRIRPAKVKIKIGKPFFAKDVTNANGEERYQQVTDSLRDRIDKMLTEIRDQK